MKGERRQRRNYRREQPEAANEWRKQYLYAEERYTTALSDDEYIRRVLSGEAEWVRIAVTDDFRDGEHDDGLPITIEVPVDPVCIIGKSVNSIEREIGKRNKRHQMGETNLDGESARMSDRLGMRPVWQASVGEWAGQHGWHADVSDPTDEWVRVLDRRETKLEYIKAALKLPKRQRLTRLDRLLDAFSLDGDPDFVELLVEYVCAHVPDYVCHCLRKLDNIHRRGRHRKAATAAQAA